MKDMSRGLAQKRHHKKHLKNKRKHDIVYHKGFSINKHVITPKLCSCIACGNMRKFFGNSKEGKTIQELKQEEKDNELR